MGWSLPFGKLWTGFSRKEFACKCGCGYDTVDAELLAVLKKLKKHFKNKAVFIDSGCRCVQHNKKIGGTPKSSHLSGRAADIRVAGVFPDMVAEYLLETYPDKYGIGRYRSFTHIDTRKGKARWDNRAKL
ncbi:peptidase M15 family protein [Vibrio phage GRLPWR]|uniref:Peptidase M15 family protein n=3 Tax=Thalassavirus TaxID=2948922 RepID=A0A2H5BH66_9CAUD|nr:endolysin [Vibrio phage Thalassa]YP_010107976.1 endolysin [Vibrio phage River4]YP_010114302.1 endolysin [Vibrio phage Gary]QQO89767.1 peptidase M15 family protein [Vibrio phage GRLPWR]AUG85335.1 peptidase M15 family protein [Vibrio phage Thalassa]QKN84790.1 peptidase M15 family protein [Vibrio phage River4]QQV88236.1 peptidase M15 family protein [Vibrio phage Gary]